MNSSLASSVSVLAKKTLQRDLLLVQFQRDLFLYVGSKAHDGSILNNSLLLARLTISLYQYKRWFYFTVRSLKTFGWCEPHLQLLIFSFLKCVSSVLYYHWCVFWFFGSRLGEHIYFLLDQKP